jgi:flagellar biosynthesis protein FlhG
MTPELRLTGIPRVPRPRTIAFTSGKGGVGKSTLVLNTALILARRGQRVALVDGDLGLASLHLLLGLTPRYDLRDVVAGERTLREIAVAGPYGLQLVPAGSGVAELASLSAAERAALVDELRAFAAPLDFLLIDTGAGIGETVLHLLEASDEALVVTQPEPTALADAYALIKVMVRSAAAYPCHVLVNLARHEHHARQTYEALAGVLLRFLGYRPGWGGWVVGDPAVAEAVVQQVPFAIRSPRCPAARCLERLADALLGTHRSGARPGPGLAREGSHG